MGMGASPFLPYIACIKSDCSVFVGNYALSMGLAAAAERSKLELFLGSYPITPASDILHTLSAWKHLGIKTFQAEDEIAGITSALGAAFSGSLAITLSLIHI